MFVLILFVIMGFVNGYLSNIQLQHIRNILLHPDCSLDLRNKTHKILKKHYLPFVFLEYRRFLQKNKWLLSYYNVNRRELCNYAFIGFFKSVERYNAKYTLHTHSRIYIQNSLYNGFRRLFPLSTINDYSYNKYGLTEYKTPIMVSGENSWIFDKIVYKREKEKEKNNNERNTRYLRELIYDLLSSEEKTLFYLRHDAYDFHIRRGYVDISHIIGDSSHETTRQKFLKIYKLIGSNFCV